MLLLTVRIGGYNGFDEGEREAYHLHRVEHFRQGIFAKTAMLLAVAEPIDKTIDFVRQCSLF